MDDQNVSNFSSSSSHRLPTVSASQALQSLSSTRFRPISTGLKQLNATLQGSLPGGLDREFLPGGLSRGQVTEVYGPSGVGKTTFAYVEPRFKEILSGFRLPEGQEPPSSPPTNRSLDDLLDDFGHFFAPTLPHLLALLLHPSANFPPEKTSLIVVDSISSLFATAFPSAINAVDGRQATGKKNALTQWAANRRWSVMGDFVSKLGKLAVTRNIAVLLTSQTTTKVRVETAAVLHPAVSGAAWDGGIASRIVLFRDWPPQQEGSQEEEVNKTKGVRYAGVLKAGGIAHNNSGAVGKVIAFTITRTGLQELESSVVGPDLRPMPIISGPPLKRKRDEIADSQSEDEELGSDEEFGWMNDNELATEGEVKDNGKTSDDYDRDREVPREDTNG
ncbi:MAG: hypothetical protein M1830_004429 [Pleopsidium flavum]|nr:MAG: hypothetical protein M1830_004429 [Pleopsidium flavum]